MSEYRQTYSWLGQRILLALVWNLRFAALVALVGMVPLCKRYRASLRPGIVRALFFIDAARFLSAHDQALARAPKGNPFVNQN